MDRVMRLVALALAAVIAVACGGSGLAVPTFEMPTFDTAGAQQLLDDAVAEARTVVDDPPGPVWDGEQFNPRLIVPLSLSYDHRVIDGAAAARFTAFLATELSDFRRVLL